MGRAVFGTAAPSRRRSGDATEGQTVVTPAEDGSILETAGRVRSGEISPLDLLREAQQRIESLNSTLNAYISVNSSAEEEARQLEVELQAGQWRGPLHGIPISLKDIIDAKGTATTAGSRVFGEGRQVETDAALVERLRAGGAVILGKTNLHEFAYGVTSENPHFGTVGNPWNSELIAGGSSGGSAVSVATRMCFGSVGTDTRGSIRIPAACCGVTGFKPTLGKVPLDGVIPLSPTLDHAGPIARSVEDAAVLASILCEDPTLEPFRFRFEPPPQVTVGICPYFLDRIDSEIEQAVWSGIDVLKQAGLAVKAVDIEKLVDAIPASTVIASVEALCYHRQFLDEQQDGYGENVLERLQTGRQHDAVDLAEAFFTRRETGRVFAEIFEEVDCLVGATIPCLPPAVGSNSIDVSGTEEGIVDALVRMNAAQNVAGVPALSLPCGFSTVNTPISLQLIAARGEDQVLLRLGHFFQSVTDWHLQRPPQD